jgi:predicted LPLAT superfamily acyltransferase
MDRTTSMPVAPHILAARSGAPILMFFGLYENRNRYRIEFVECGQAATSNSRGDQLQPAVNAYASVLEEYARRYPLNWFNFYPYWGTGGDGT